MTGVGGRMRVEGRIHCLSPGAKGNGFSPPHASRVLRLKRTPARRRETVKNSLKGYTSRRRNATTKATKPRRRTLFAWGLRARGALESVGRLVSVIRATYERTRLDVHEAE